MTLGSLDTVNLFVPRKATAPFFPSCTGSHHKATPRIHATAVPHSLKAQQKSVAAASSDTAATGTSHIRRSLSTCIYAGFLRFTLAGDRRRTSAPQQERSTAFRCCGLHHQTQNGYRADTREPHHSPGSRRGRAAGRYLQRIQRRYRRNPRRSWGQHPNQERARR